MYRPKVFAEDRLDVLHALIVGHPFGLLASSGEGGLAASHMPFVLEEKSGGMGVLKAHLARANPDLEVLAHQKECLAIFQGPEGYITPSWYPSKAEHGKVVPTWNYAVVHAWGQPKLVEDPQWLRAHVESLTNQHEADRADSWAVSDAPGEFIDALLRGIVGIELPISRIEGKWKVSQNRDEADRKGVAAGLRIEDQSSVGLGPSMADWIDPQ